MSMSLVESNRTDRMWWSSFCAIFWIALAASGCDGTATAGASQSSGALVDAAEWTPVDEADDPFIAKQADDATCDIVGYETEEYEGEPAFFVDTGVCNYLTVEQPALHDVAEGDTLHLRLYHYELTATEPAEAYLAIAFGDQTVWDETVELPADPDMVDTTFEAGQAIAAGDPILFHVNNHGDNNYVLIELSTVDQ